jgi:hypothetical protein
MARVEPQPDHTPLSPQQEAARLGITLRELAEISEQAVREQAEWLAMDEIEWRERKEKRWRGEVRVDRRIGEGENRRRTEEAERQEQREATQERTTAIARPLSAPPPPVHPELATAQLGLTPEEAVEVHKECIRAQEEIQEEIEEKDRVRRQQMAEQDAHDEHQRTQQEYEGQYEPPVAPTSHDDGRSINRRGLLHQAVEHRLPTPTTHPELERHAHEDYGAAYEPPTVATPYDDDDVIVSNRGDTPPSGCQPQPLPSNAQPPLQPPDHDEYTTRAATTPTPLHLDTTKTRVTSRPWSPMATSRSNSSRTRCSPQATQA